MEYVVSRSHLRDHTTIWTVNLDLRGDAAGDQSPVQRAKSGGSLIAGGFKSEEAWLGAGG
jgi:hypothetical protein